MPADFLKRPFWRQPETALAWPCTRNGGQQGSESSEGHVHMPRVTFLSTEQYSQSCSTPDISTHGINPVYGFHAGQLPFLPDELWLAIGVCILHP